MKKYVTKLICLIMMLTLVGVIEFYDIDLLKEFKSTSSNLFSTKLYNPNVISLDTFETLGDAPASDSEADSVSSLPTSEKTYSKPIKVYVSTSSGLNVRKGPGTGYDKVFTASKCTELFVYKVVKSNGNAWYKVSDLIDYYVRGSSDYLSVSVPSGCGGSVTTTTRPAPSFSVSTATTPESGYTKMFSNKKGTITATVKDIKYLRQSELTGFTTSVTYNGSNVTDKFTIGTPSPQSDGSVKISLKMKDSTDYSKGTYTVKIKNRGVEKTATFTIEDKYYYISWKIDEAHPSQQYNMPYTWTFSVVKKENVNLGKVEVNVQKYEKNKWNDSNKLTVSKDSTTGEVKVTLPENQKEGIAGNYKVTIKYRDTGNTAITSDYTYSYEFELTKPQFKVTRQSLDMNRYMYTPRTSNYTLDINSVKLRFGSIDYIVANNGTNDINIAASDFAMNYSIIKLADKPVNQDYNNIASNTASFLYDDKGNIVYPYSGELLVYRLVKNATETRVSYYTITADPNAPESDPDRKIFTKYENQLLSDVEATYPNIETMIEANPSYKIQSNGYISYYSAGSTTFQERSVIEDQVVFSNTGGEIFINVNISGLNGNQSFPTWVFDEAKVTITNDKGEVVSNRSEFDSTIIVTDSEKVNVWGWRIDYVKSAQIQIIYIGQDTAFTGDYTVLVEFDGGSFTETFSLFSGPIDYYARAQRELTDGKDKAIPANSKIPWYAGIYLSDGSNNRIKRNEENFSVHIYDKRADLDSDNNIYFYDLINYQIKVTNYTGTNISYQLIENGVTKPAVTNEAFSTFKNKYKHAAEQIEANMIIMSGNSPSASDHVRYYVGSSYIDIYRVYMEDDVQKVDYSANGGARTVDLYTNVITQYERLSLFINNYLVTDTQGNIIGDSVRGNYRRNVASREDISELFDIHFNDYDESAGSENELKAISITPKTEVAPGEYYVYLGYNQNKGVGDINNDVDNAIFRWDEYPQFWEQNIHMVIIEYVAPKYDFDILPPILSNEGNSNEEVYNNVKGSALINLSFIDTYNFNNTLTSKVYTCNTENCAKITTKKNDEDNDEDDDEEEQIVDKSTWTEVTERFGISYDFSELTGEATPVTVDDGEETGEEPQKFGKVLFETLHDTNDNGIYIIEFTYTYNGVTKVKYVTFEINRSCKTLVPTFVDNKNEIYDYFSDTLPIKVETMFIGEGKEIVPTIINSTNTTYITDPVNHTIKDANDNILFTYTYNYSAGKSANYTDYNFVFRNTAKSLSSGTYKIFFTYEDPDAPIPIKPEVPEGSEEIEEDDSYKYINSNTVNFRVIKSTPRIDFDLAENDTVIVDEDYFYIRKSVTAHFMSDEDLDNTRFVLAHYDWSVYDYVDISSPTSPYKCSTISVAWDNSTKNETSISGIVQIKIGIDDIDTKAQREDYLLQAYLPGVSTPKESYIPEIGKMLDWGVSPSDWKVNGTYRGEEVSYTNYFYEDMEDVSIDLKITTPYKKTISWAVTNSSACASEYNGLGNSCNPTSINLNYAFTATNTTNTDGKLSLRYTPGSTPLAKGLYYIVLYYSDNPDERVILRIAIQQKLMNIDFDDYIIYSESGGGSIEGLFQNKMGHIYLPVLTSGISTSETTVRFADVNGTTLTTRPFEYDRTKYNEKGILDITYNPSQLVADAKDYTVIVTALDNTSVSKVLTFTMNKDFFSYTIGGAFYTPDPDVPPKANQNGSMFFRITAEGLDNLNGLKGAMLDNTSIINSAGENVTTKFNFRTENVNTSSFYLYVEYNASSNLAPGVYTLNTSYTKDGYKTEKSSSFIIGGYDKDFTIDNNVQIISDTDDNKVHRNVEGTFRMTYSSQYDLSDGVMYIKVFDSSNSEVTNKFSYQITSSLIDVTYDATDPKLPAGDYRIEIYYDEAEKVVSKSVNVKIYGNFNTIVISNINKYPLSGESSIYSDRAGQYYDFDINKAGISLATYNLRAEILNSDGDDVSDNFGISDLGNKIRVNINEFGSSVDTYSIRMYVEDEEGIKNYSNRLNFTIDRNYYSAKILDSSTISQVTNYNSDTTSIYDKDGALISYDFTTDYSDPSRLRIKLFKDGVSVKESSASTSNHFDYSTGSLEKGTYKAALCIGNVIYDYIEMPVVRYIAIEDVVITVAGTQITTDSFNANMGNSTLQIEVVPSNATATNFNVSSSDSSVFAVSNTVISGKKEGTANLVISNSEITKTYSVTVKQLLSSSTYEIDHVAKTVYVKNMKVKNLTYASFIGSLNGLISGYKVTNASNTTVTSGNVGTGYKLVNGSNTYTIIVIGDVTGDGNINVLDVAWLYQTLRNKRTFNTYQTKAGLIRKSTSTNAVDVAWLYAFVRGTRTSI